PAQPAGFRLQRERLAWQRQHRALLDRDRPVEGDHRGSPALDLDVDVADRDVVALVLVEGALLLALRTSRAGPEGDQGGGVPPAGRPPHADASLVAAPAW